MSTRTFDEICEEVKTRAEKEHKDGMFTIPRELQEEAIRAKYPKYVEVIPELMKMEEEIQTIRHGYKTLEDRRVAIRAKISELNQELERLEDEEFNMDDEERAITREIMAHRMKKEKRELEVVPTRRVFDHLDVRGARNKRIHLL
jgi:septal ring factor EnvC (AmiA/AmiB activator)